MGFVGIALWFFTFAIGMEVIPTDEGDFAWAAFNLAALGVVLARIMRAERKLQKVPELHGPEPR